MIARFKKTPRWSVLAVFLFASLGLITLTDAQNKTEAEAVSGGGSIAQSTAADKVAGASTNSTEATSALKKVVEGGVVTAPQAEPIVGPVFTDNFDEGASKHWKWYSYTDEGLPPEHAVKNGELVLAHSQQCSPTTVAGHGLSGRVERVAQRPGGRIPLQRPPGQVVPAGIRSPRPTSARVS